LYSDGLHPSEQGAYLAALVVYAKLLGKSPIGLPRVIESRGGVGISLSVEEASLLQEAAAAALEPPGSPSP
jgi:hypothetical protein